MQMRQGGKPPQAAILLPTCCADRSGDAAAAPAIFSTEGMETEKSRSQRKARGAPAAVPLSLSLRQALLNLSLRWALASAAGLLLLNFRLPRLAASFFCGEGQLAQLEIAISLGNCAMRLQTTKPCCSPLAASSSGGPCKAACLQAYSA